MITSRHGDFVRSPVYKYKSTDKAPSVSATLLYNSLPDDIKMIDSVPQFAAKSFAFFEEKFREMYR
jgi:hypothetical protein